MTIQMDEITITVEEQIDLFEFGFSVLQLRFTSPTETWLEARVASHADYKENEK